MQKVMHSIWFLCFIASTTATAGGNQTINSYPHARSLLYEVFKITGGTTLYCNCRHANRVIDATSCGYIPSSNNERTKRTEVEHMVPASTFGRSFQEWQNPQNFPKCRRSNGKRKSGRDCARTNLEFRRMEADMYNLWLSIGELNLHRSNFKVGIIPGEPRNYGSCDFEVANQQVEPRPEVRGNMARAYLYMDTTYPNRGVITNESFRAMLKQWDLQYPVSEAEHNWAKEIHRVQGNCNPFVLNCKSLQKAQ